MRISIFLSLALLSMNASTAASQFLLGADYSESAPPSTSAMATDSSGSLYFLSPCQSSATASSCVTKLSADGKTILWQNNLGFTSPGNALAVDPNGGVYVAGYQTSNPPIFVAKLSDSGSGLAWKTQMALGVLRGVSVLSADSAGRIYVAGNLGDYFQGSQVIRLNAAGTAIDYTAQVPGSVAFAAVDRSGAAFFTGYNTPGPFLARLEPDGSAGFYTLLSPLGEPGMVAVDSNGNAVALSRAADGFLHLQRFDSAGAVTLSTLVGDTIPSQHMANFVLDAAGNAYVTGSSYIYDNGFGFLSQAMNSLGTCGSGGTVWEWLRVFAPDGSLLQATYLPPGGKVTTAIVDIPLIAAGRNSTIFVAHSSGPTFAPSQAGPFADLPSGTGSVPYFLWRLSPKANAQVFPLACMGSAATYTTGPIAPGELVTLFGSGLGPQEGMKPQAEPQSPFPIQAAGIQVTFDGIPAPLLWVQDSQINAIVPWSLTPGKLVQVCVSINGARTNCLTWPVEQTAVSVFTVDGVHAALNQDGSINSAGNPAAFGSIVSVFATGLGPISPPQADGTLVGFPLPNNLLQDNVFTTVAVGGPPVLGVTVPFQITYAGPAPNLVAGMSQINFKAASIYGVIQVFVSVPSSSATARVLPFNIYIARP